MENKHTKEELKIMQSWNLEKKIAVTQTRILEWIKAFDGNVYVSFSGGKDSTVLSDIVARVWKSNMEIGYNYGPLTLVFIDTGLEYPEIRKFAKGFPEYLESTYNIPVKLDILRPKMNFKQVIEKYGYPVISKRIAGYVYSARKSPDCARKKFLTGEIENVMFGNGKYKFLLDAPFKISDYCCHKMKIEPNKNYQKKYNRYVILATMAEESHNRKTNWIKNGCNLFYGEIASKPMSFWTEQDVLQYLKVTKIPYCSVYGDIVPINNQLSLFDDTFGGGCKLRTTGCSRTGCMFCMFGVHLEKHPNRFERLKITHPKQYDFCINGRHYDENGMIVPDQNGLGIGKVLDFLKVKY